MLLIVSITTIILNTLTFYGPVVKTSYAQPIINDPKLSVKLFIEGLSSPTSMAFLDNNNILILEKEGQVRLVSNGMLQEQPVLQIPVDSKNERGLLGITGDITQGNLYFFEVNENRNGLMFNAQNNPGLSDLVADTEEESSSVILGTGFGGISDIETGPDGFLYVLTFDRETGDGNLYRVTSSAQ
ncbi:MAG TPA: PQQ-dependent sugar dehydrogenase [Nitrososphaeraceae archaeon]|nr:PQQ-dependent sugar dehydrogenase [Nitrososphaeraceae archaeon]